MPERIRAVLGSLRIGRAFSSQDPTLEVNLIGYGVGVLVMAFVVCWWAVRGERDGNLVGALGVFAAAVTGGLFKKSSTVGAAAPTGTGGVVPTSPADGAK